MRTITVSIGLPGALWGTDENAFGSVSQTAEDNHEDEKPAPQS
jgi:hypothetical protein